VVWGLREGRQAAAEVDEFLAGETRLAYQGGIPKRQWIAPPITVKPLSSNHSDIAGMDVETVSVAASA
jgi:glutamate synthase (NADPH/NADH)